MLALAKPCAALGWFPAAGYTPAPGKTLGSTLAFHCNMTAAMVVAGILGSAGIIRVVRSATFGVHGELYIEAARIAGLSDVAILTRHVIPRILGPILEQLSLFAARAPVSCGR